MFFQGLDGAISLHRRSQPRWLSGQELSTETKEDGGFDPGRRGRFLAGS